MSAARSADAESQPGYYGWLILAVVMVCCLLVFGLGVYSFGIFVKPAAAEYGLSRADASSGIISYLIGTAIWSPLIGRLMDRFPTRYVSALGALAFGGGLMAAGYVSSPLLTLFLVGGPVAAGAATLGQLLIGVSLSRWFRRHRGKAVGLAYAASALGGTFISPLTALLVGRLGWRHTLMVEGAVAGLLMGALTLLLLRDGPQGSLAPVVDADTADSPAVEGRQWSVAQLFVRREFLLLTLAIALITGFDNVLITSWVPYATDAGISVQSASLAFSVLTTSTIIGKLLCGFLAERVDRRILFAIIAISNAVIAATLIVKPSFTVIVLVFGATGMAVGAIGTLQTIMIGQLFGVRSFGLVAGAMSFVITCVSIVSLRLGGESFDRFGSYKPIFALGAIGALAAALIIIPLGGGTTRAVGPTLRGKPNISPVDE